MSDRELLTECLEALTHDAAQRTFAGGVRMSQLAIKLRAHLAAPRPEPTHPGYILGSQWLETAYSRSSAGEAEANVLRDYGLIREEAFTIGVEHLRQENERLREALREIADETYDTWTNGAKAQRIAESALKEVPR